MPRKARASVGGVIYHVLNRANSRRRMFYSDKDYLGFLKALRQALARWPGMQLLAMCIMPNHWHLVLKPSREGELSEFMRWLTQTHTQRWRHAKNTVGYGSLYQGRFKSFIVQDDGHFLILCRYVEANALRGRLAQRAEDWQWSSAWMRHRGDETSRAMLCDWPVDRPRNWTALLNESQGKAETKRIQTSIVRNRPLGDDQWVQRMSKRFGLEHTLRPPGRPKLAKETKT